MKIKKFFRFLFFLMLTFSISTEGFSQAIDSLKRTTDTSAKKKLNLLSNVKDTTKTKQLKDSTIANKRPIIIKPDDTLLNTTESATSATIASEDSIADSALFVSPQFLNEDTFTNNQNTGNLLKKLLAKNQFINVSSAPVYRIDEARKTHGKEFIFYSLFTIVLILGIFKTFYSGYFNNLFRVYFNTSLRQTQLTDQLLQAKLPSLILNLFFTLTAGMYVWLLFSHFNPPRLISPKMLLPFCILSIAIIYSVKYSLLKFTGYITGIQETTDNYIFIIFLVNKIAGILLLPFVILLSFSPEGWVPAIATISGLVLGLFFLSRYIKSYGFIEGKIPLNPFHFIIYIAGAEIIPLLILYKIAKDYML